MSTRQIGAKVVSAGKRVGRERALWLLPLVPLLAVLACESDPLPGEPSVDAGASASGGSGGASGSYGGAAPSAGSATGGSAGLPAHVGDGPPPATGGISGNGSTGGITAPSGPLSCNDQSILTTEPYDGFGGHSWEMIGAGCELAVSSPSNDSNVEVVTLPHRPYAIALGIGPDSDARIVCGNNWEYPDHIFQASLRGPKPTTGASFTFDTPLVPPTNIGSLPDKNTASGLLYEQGASNVSGVDGRWWTAGPGSGLQVLEACSHPKGLAMRVKFEANMKPAIRIGNAARGTFKLTGRCTMGVSGLQ